ncbi:hypothetical protein [Nonomuraea sp. NPDC049684]|uniref:hypothetical protein n=1 Tax=Nonomuraea sp. NPDC049684 TaxID=3364356 RepID=UPI003788E029
MHPCRGARLPGPDGAGKSTTFLRHHEGGRHNGTWTLVRPALRRERAAVLGGLDPDRPARRDVG